MPPRAEQEELLQRIHAETQEVDTASSRLEREIDLLREYRTRLIADVVTGKLDVREAVAGLPDKMEEPEPLDEGDTLTNDEDETAGDLDAAPEEAEARLSR